MVEKGKLQNNVILTNTIIHTHINKFAKKKDWKDITLHLYWLVLKSE